MYYEIEARSLWIFLQVFHPKPQLVKFKQVHAVCSCIAHYDIVLKVLTCCSQPVCMHLCARGLQSL